MNLPALDELKQVHYVKLFALLCFAQAGCQGLKSSGEN